VLPYYTELHISLICNGYTSTMTLTTTNVERNCLEFQGLKLLRRACRRWPGLVGVMADVGPVDQSGSPTAVEGKMLLSGMQSQIWD
jgi:hypothetical protein